MVGILDLKRNSIKLGLCGEYKNKWDNCKTKRELIRLAMDSNGVEFMADSLAFGWGMDKDYIQREFSEYINGNFLIHENGYTSEMFVGVSDGNIEPRSTISLFVGCNCTINLKKGFIGKIYLCGSSDVDIQGEDDAKCWLYVYGENMCSYSSLNKAEIKREDITESKWRKE